MFAGMWGPAEHQLDGKNRIRIPAQFRPFFPEGERLFFVQYNVNSLAIMSESVLEAKLGGFDEFMPDEENEVRAAIRYMSGVMPITEDNQKRIMIPPLFRKAAGIEKDVVSVGMGKYVEVFAKEVYERDIASMSMRDAASAFKKLREKREKKES